MTRDHIKASLRTAIEQLQATLQALQSEDSERTSDAAPKLNGGGSRREYAIREVFATPTRAEALQAAKTPRGINSANLSFYKRGA